MIFSESVGSGACRDILDNKKRYAYLVGENVGTFQ